MSVEGRRVVGCHTPLWSWPLWGPSSWPPALVGFRATSPNRASPGRRSQHPALPGPGEGVLRLAVGPGVSRGRLALCSPGQRPQVELAFSSASHTVLVLPVLQVPRQQEEGLLCSRAVKASPPRALQPRLLPGPTGLPLTGHTAAGQGPLNSTRPRAPLDARHCPGAGFSPRTPGLPAAAAGNAPAGPHVCFQSHRVTPSVPHRRPRCSEQGRLLIKRDWAMWPERAPRPDPWGIGADGVLGIR